VVNVPIGREEKKLFLEQILDEIKARSSVDKVKEMLGDCFPEQRAFIVDRSPFLAGFCTRRAGKSYGVGMKHCITSLMYPEVSTVYIALTRSSADRIMIKDVLKHINRKYKLGAEFNKSDLSMKFPNGSVMYLLGMDSSDDEAAKVLGQKFKLASVDEAGSFRRDLHGIVYDILGPACADLDGQVAMISTPTNITRGLFYDVVWAKTEPGWKIHKWTAFNNPHMRDAWQKRIDMLVAANPRVVETPGFKQQYLGEYVIDTDALVYKFSAERNLIKRAELPELAHYVLGVDLGFDDPSAFTITGYNDSSKDLFIPFSYKQSGMDFTAVANYIKTLLRTYNPYKIVVDNASKQGVEEMRNRHGLPLEAAEKHGKIDYIGIMNAEFMMGNIKIVEEDAAPLIDEYQSLIWDDKSTKKQEHPSCANHCADSALYPWRYCYQYGNMTQTTKQLTEEEKIDIWFEREARKLEADKHLEWWEA
jgi:hypothetical protein